MGEHPVQVDLFGNPINNPVDVPAPKSTAPRDSVNDMDLAQAVLADIADERTAALHVDDDGQIRRCTQWATEPVPHDMAVVVEQLLTARYLTTRRGPCTGHGSLITTTRTGRNAVHRWHAYRRPPSWGPPPDTAATNNRSET